MQITKKTCFMGLAFSTLFGVSLAAHSTNGQAFLKFSVTPVIGTSFFQYDGLKERNGLKSVVVQYIDPTRDPEQQVVGQLNGYLSKSGRKLFGDNIDVFKSEDRGNGISSILWGFMVLYMDLTTSKKWHQSSKQLGVQICAVNGYTAHKYANFKPIYKSSVWENLKYKGLEGEKAYNSLMEDFTKEHGEKQKLGQRLTFCRTPNEEGFVERLQRTRTWCEHCSRSEGKPRCLRHSKCSECRGDLTNQIRGKLSTAVHYDPIYMKMEAPVAFWGLRHCKDCGQREDCGRRESPLDTCPDCGGDIVGKGFHLSPGTRLDMPGTRACKPGTRLVPYLLTRKATGKRARKMFVYKVPKIKKHRHDY